MFDQSRHRRIETVAFLELDREAFGEIAGANARRIEALQNRERRFDLARRRAELLGDRGEIAGEIAGLVDEIDEILPDHPPRGIGDCHHHLSGKMIGKRRLGRDESFEIIIVAVAAAGTDAGPFRIGGRRIGRRTLAFLAGIVGKNVFQRGTQFALDGIAAGDEVAVHPIGRSLLLPVHLGLGRRRGLGRILPFARALQQGIAFELLFDIGRQIQIRELQQLDRLHQLRRHHQAWPWRNSSF